VSDGRAIKLHPNQADRLQRFGLPESVDIHCHCLPGLDDGPADLDAALRLCRALVRDGITTVLATPHQVGKYDTANFAGAVRAAVAVLQRALDREAIPLTVRPGGDVRVDERLIDLLEQDEVCTLGDGGRFVLLELPHGVWVEPEPLMSRLRDAGYQAILSHPERYPKVMQQPEAVRPWVRAGAALQVTAGSLRGDFGAASADAAWALCDAGWVALVASDAHDAVARPPAMTGAITALRQRFGLLRAKRLCVENPLAILENTGRLPANDPARPQPTSEATTA